MEPAVNDANGSTVFLLTPNSVPFPSVSNPRASVPMYIPIEGIDPAPNHPSSPL